MKILSIEDESMVQKTIEFKLTKDGHEVFTASNGKEGIEKIRTESFDLIITDTYFNQSKEQFEI